MPVFRRDAKYGGTGSSYKQGLCTKTFRIWYIRVERGLSQSMRWTGLISFNGLVCSLVNWIMLRLITFVVFSTTAVMKQRVSILSNLAVCWDYDVRHLCWSAGQAAEATCDRRPLKHFCKRFKTCLHMKS